ncbi:FecR family protein [Sphingopyxis sp. MWB1]|uniref:FecR family protein n=1 Tax=Sphingopyxis sp. MWB1 TaxID=1537715 RepID=UPI00051A7A1E|nr:FecR domain-containing protein [Sphingopyxis sp. MWB1]
MIGPRSAEDWLALMEGPDAPRHRKAFEAWHSDPAHAAAYAELKRAFDLSPRLSAERIAHLAQGHDAARRKNRRQWAAAAVVALALSAGLAWTLLAPASPDGRQSPAAIAREQRLEDGTRVALGDQAVLTAQFTAQARIVTMTQGRARFTVAHDRARPFRVIAGSSITTALGTIFEIDLHRAAPRIRLIEGAVEVASRSGAHRALRLAPGESAEVGAGGPRRIATNRAAPRVELDAQRLELGAIIKRANRHNSRQIGLAEPALARLKVSGRFSIDDGEALARKLAAALDLAIEAGPQGPILRQH